MTEEQINKTALDVYPDSPGYKPEFIREQENFDQALRREGYVKVLKEIEELPKIKGWVARDLHGLQFSTQKPIPDKDDEDEWFDFGSADIIDLPESFSKYFKLKEMEKPIKVELLIRKI